MHRTVFGAMALAAALFISAPTVAVAATPAQTASAPQATGSLTVPITNNGSNAVATITSFQVINGVLNAVGTVTGTLVSNNGTILNVTNQPFTAPVQNLQTGGSCKILTLDLGPLHLDLLGLVVDLNAIHLSITAQPGSGNLLGNLLCAVAHLLDNNGGALAGIANLLNQILGQL